MVIAAAAMAMAITALVLLASGTGSAVSVRAPAQNPVPRGVHGTTRASPMFPRVSAHEAGRQTMKHKCV